MTKIDHKIKIPDYRIIRKIGEGGMSVVYLAFQESLKREVALKIMRPIVTDEENVVKRFAQEAEIIAKLYHPNIVNIYEVGHVEGDVLFYSMPYLQHGDLTSFVYQNDTELKQMIANICDGLGFAHTQGVVHRDIKPENILFDQFGNVQIADFGIALSSGRSRFTKDSKIVGSVYYMSPEQAQAKHVDKRSDIYGLGAILYELLTGDPVYDEDNDLSMMMAHLSSPIPKLPKELSHWQEVIDNCLAKSPNQRFQNVEALKQAVLDVDVYHTPSWQRTPVIAAFAVLTMAVIFFGFWLYNQGVTTANEQLLQSTAGAGNAKNINSPATEAEPQVRTQDGLNNRSIPQNSNNSGANNSVQYPSAVNNLSEVEVTELLDKAKQNINKKQLTTPQNDNALDQILQLLKNMPDHQVALNLLSDVMAGYYDLLYQAVQNDNLNLANRFAESVAEVRHRTILINENLLTQLEQNTDLERSLLIGAVVEKVKASKLSLNQQQAKQYITLIDQVIPGQDLVDDLLDSINSMLKPGQVLKDNQGITTVVVTPQYKSKKGLLNYGLAVTQSEINYAQFDRFVNATGHPVKRCKSEIKANLIFTKRNYSKPGFKVADDMPVVCVTWLDANQYATWLSQKSGLSYRLPTAREWRHINKLSGETINCGGANLAGQEFPDKDENLALFNCDDGSSHVASSKRYPKNKLGLSGFQGNVSEWLAGCEKLGKFKAIFNPDDLCDNNPVIGKSWVSGTEDTGAVRKVKFDQAWTHIGFRLIRDLRKER